MVARLKLSLIKINEFYNMFKICEELVLIAIIITFFYKFHKLLFCLVLSAITTHLIKFLLLCNLCISYFAHNIFISFISTTTISLLSFILYHPSLFITLSFLLISFIYFLFVLFSFSSHTKNRIK